MSFRKTRTGKLLSASVLAAFLVAPVASLAQEAPANPTDTWDIARGGQLYDNWMAVLGQDAPEGNHPLYPAEGKKSGKTTWRCKECHGWDYLGKDGAYSKGSHYTGIAGVMGASAKSQAEIAAAIMSPEHGYTEALLPASSVKELAMFIKDGLIDTDPYINRADKSVNGDPANGARMFQTICAVCHGFDGKEINFKDEDNPEYVGTVAADNPWEALHKIRFGQPGVPMIGLISLEMQQIVDLLAYTQTLPTE